MITAYRTTQAFADEIRRLEALAQLYEDLGNREGARVTRARMQEIAIDRWVERAK